MTEQEAEARRMVPDDAEAVSLEPEQKAGGFVAARPSGTDILDVIADLIERLDKAERELEAMTELAAGAINDELWNERRELREALEWIADHSTDRKASFQAHTSLQATRRG
jgi:hypothetical protein